MLKDIYVVSRGAYDEESKEGYVDLVFTENSMNVTYYAYNNEDEKHEKILSFDVLDESFYVASTQTFLHSDYERSPIILTSNRSDVKTLYTLKEMLAIGVDRVQSGKCIILQYPIRKSNIEFTLIEGDYFPSDIYNKVFKDFCTKIAQRETKAALLSYADPNRSIAYLEAQVDFLSKIIFAIVDSLPLDYVASIKKDVEGYDEFKELSEETSVLDIKSLEKCLNEMRTTKAKIRELQQAYFETKNN